MSDKATAKLDKRILDNDKQIKPIDFGKAGTCGSLSPLGNIILLYAFHSKQGFAGLSTSHPFPYSERYNQSTVRQYRRSLVDLEGFGPKFKTSPIDKNVALIEDAIPEVELFFEDGSSAIMTLVTCDQGVVQRWRFSGQSPHWQGFLSLQRASYTQLTEGGPLPDVSPDMSLRFSDGRLMLRDDNLNSTVIIDGFSSDAPAQKARTSDPINILIPEDKRHTVILTYAIAEDTASATVKSEALGNYRDPANFEVLLAQEKATWRNYMADIPDDLVLRRALVYGRTVSVPTSKDAVCIMTDHVLLPLSWNRDAYFVAIALIRCGRAHWDLVRRHLTWMFEEADRGNSNEWGRCYLLNGVVKDRAYQLDQQLFPLLELADYVLYSGDRETLERLRPHIKPLVGTILSHRHETAYLFPTDETPGDDPLDYKYHFSSHVLAWHTFKLLDKLLPGDGYQAIADKVHADTLTYFTASNGKNNLFAYATDLEGNHLFYHDANDVPLALAPIWGFISEEDEIWQATVAFAFTECNENGYYGNNRLGSIHTPAPWPLGDVQKLMMARLLKQPEMEAEALQDIGAAAQWDGGLPEAYDGESFNVVSRNWFAWPNAYYAMTQLENLKIH